MNEDMAPMIDALQQAGSHDLFRLAVAIHSLLNDPARIIAIRKELHVGKQVAFRTYADDRVHVGIITALRDDKLTVSEPAANLRWTLNYPALDLSLKVSEAQPDTGFEPSPPPIRAAQHRFRVGDKVTFDDGKGRALVGYIKRVNPKSISIDVPGHPGIWRVGHTLLRHVVDV